MSGEILAIGAALFFSLNVITTRRAVLKVNDAILGLLITIPLCLILYLIFLLFTGQITSIANFELHNYIWLSAAGILNFTIGTLLIFIGIKLIGANITQLLSRVSPIVPLVIGITILNEPLSPRIVAGVLMIISGIIIAGLNLQTFRFNQSSQTRIPVKTLFFGIGAGISWGTSAVMVKIGLQDSGNPVAGAFICFLAATIVLGISLINSGRRESLFNMELKTVLLFCLPGLTLGIAQLLRFTALSIAPVSITAALMSTSPMMTILLSFLLNRKLEIFTTNIIIGAIVVVTGTILLF